MHQQSGFTGDSSCASVCTACGALAQVAAPLAAWQLLFPVPNGGCCRAHSEDRCSRALDFEALSFCGLCENHAGVSTRGFCCCDSRGCTSPGAKAAGHDDLQAPMEARRQRLAACAARRQPARTMLRGQLAAQMMAMQLRQMHELERHCGRWLL